MQMQILIEDLSATAVQHHKTLEFSGQQKKLSS